VASAGSRNRLNRCDAFLLQGWAISSQHDFGSSRCEVGESSNWEVFVVECGVISENLIRLESCQ
jgi:hypothetical protein